MKATPGAKWRGPGCRTSAGRSGAAAANHFRHHFREMQRRGRRTGHESCANQGRGNCFLARRFERRRHSLVHRRYSIDGIDCCGCQSSHSWCALTLPPSARNWMPAAMRPCWSACPSVPLSVGLSVLPSRSRAVDAKPEPAGITHHPYVSQQESPTARISRPLSQCCPTYLSGPSKSSPPSF